MLRQKNKSREQKNISENSPIKLAQENKRQKQSMNSNDIISRQNLDQSKQQKQSLVLYTLQKLLAESAQRQQKYIDFIKQQKQQIFNITEKYVKNLAKYEREIKEFISKKQSQKNNKRFQKVHRLLNKPPPNKYNKIQYTQNSQYELNCQIRFLYIIPIVKDYLREQFPNKFSFQILNMLPYSQIKCLQALINPQLDQEQINERVKNGYSIQIFSPESSYVSFSFILSHFNENAQSQKILQYYRNHDVQFNFIDQTTKIVLGFGKINLQQLLYFNQEKQQSWVIKVPIVAFTRPEQPIVFIYIQLCNKAVAKNELQHHTHKISQPISISRQQIKYYNDKQSRLLQRINQYKNVQNNAIPKGRDSEDKNILMHQKRKELEQIQQYKETNKNKYIQKVFDQAVQQFQTQSIQLGECKYMPFVYLNRSDRQQKVKIQILYNICNGVSSDSGQKVPNKGSLQQKIQNINVQVMEPSKIEFLLRNQILSVPSKQKNHNTDYIIDKGYIFLTVGQSILFYIKIICQSISIKRFQVIIRLNNDFGQTVYSDRIILKVCPPISNNVYYYYSYAGDCNQIQIQIPSSMKNTEQPAKSKSVNVIGLTNSVQFQNIWEEGYSLLNLKLTSLKNMSVGFTYTYFLLIYDASYHTRIACYEFIFEGVEKIGQHKIDLGQTQTFAFKLKIPPTKQSSDKQKYLVNLGTSDYLKSRVQISSSHSKAKQFTVEPNVQYNVIVNYLCFEMTPVYEKLVISCVEVLSKRSLKKYLLVLRKNQSTYKSKYTIICQQDKETQFDFQLFCKHKQQTTYKLRSSNYSLMTIMQQTIVMFTGQSRSIKLKFNLWEGHQNNAFGSTQQYNSVVLGVDDGITSNLYLFQLVLEQ